MDAPTLTIRPAPQLLHQAVLESKPRHWLLDSIYGRELLMLRMRQLVPSVSLSIWSDGYEYDVILDLLIDDLRLRDWKRPVGLRNRLAYLKTIFRLLLQLRRGEVE